MFTMTFAAKSLSSAAVGALRLVTAGFAAVLAFGRGLVNRREILFLSEVDDRALKDIGLVRSDLAGALATSWLRDPSAILAARSAERSGIAAARRDEGTRQAAAAPAPVVSATRGQTATPRHGHLGQTIACST